MSYVLKYFRWGYQPHFLISVTLAAERLFTALDPGLKPRVFLVRFRTNDDERYEPVCLEPEEFDELVERIADARQMRRRVPPANEEVLMRPQTYRVPLCVSAFSG